MADLGLAPSEVRDMTVGEIWAVMWARTRESDTRENSLESMYTELLQAKEKEAAINDNAI